eukprot:3833443-Rhodomonas_salina.1
MSTPPKATGNHDALYHSLRACLQGGGVEKEVDASLLQVQRGLQVVLGMHAPPPDLVAMLTRGAPMSYSLLNSLHCISLPFQRSRNTCPMCTSTRI